MDDPAGHLQPFHHRVVGLRDAAAVGRQPLFELQPGNAVLFLGGHGEAQQRGNRAAVPGQAHVFVGRHGRPVPGGGEERLGEGVDPGVPVPVVGLDAFDLCLQDLHRG